MKFLSYLSIFRISHYLKNLLIFAPFLLTFSINAFSVYILIILLIGFAAFSLAASAIYIFNDILDIDVDKLHPYKRKRAIASGLIPIPIALLLSLFLIIASLSISYNLSNQLFIILFLYILLNFGYSLFLKRIPILDCFMLATFYTARILFGAIIIGLQTPFWLLTFSAYFFLSLSLAKRYSELILIAGDLPRRGYSSSDSDFIKIFGIASGVVSFLILTFYINTSNVFLNFNYPGVLWFVIFLLMYWFAWIWLNSMRGNIDKDPILFSINDRTSQVILFLILILFLIGKSGNYYSFF